MKSLVYYLAKINENYPEIEQLTVKDYDELSRQILEDMKNGNFTDNDIENAKKGIIATINTIDDEQDTGITYYFGQELSESDISIQEYIKRIESVSRQDIENIAKNTAINTIYFLKD